MFQFDGPTLLGLAAVLGSISNIIVALRRKSARPAEPAEKPRALEAQQHLTRHSRHIRSRQRSRSDKAC